MVKSYAIKKAHLVSAWTWADPEEICGICRIHLDGCAPGCEYPGDDCPVAWGKCTHVFHLPCIMSWLNPPGAEQERTICPMCRQPWEFDGEGGLKKDTETPPAPTPSTPQPGTTGGSREGAATDAQPQQTQARR